MNEVTTAQMKELERLADAAGLPYLRMMENAGTAAAREPVSYTHLERPQICRLLYFIILMQPFTNPRNFRKVFVYVQIVCRTSAYFAINGH